MSTPPQRQAISAAEDVGPDWIDLLPDQPAGMHFECSSLIDGQPEGVQVFSDRVVVYGSKEPAGGCSITSSSVTRWWLAPRKVLVLLGIDAITSHEARVPAICGGPLAVALTDLLGKATPAPG